MPSVCVNAAVFLSAAVERYIYKNQRKKEMSGGKFMYTLTSRHTNSQHSVPLEKQLPKLAAHVPLIMLASHSCPGSLSPLLLLLDR